MTANGHRYVVMGVAGSGKTVIGAAFARAIGAEFVDGDDYHSAENVARMAAGIPLTDADRAAWLRALAERLGEARRRGTDLVLACSALKRRYRDVLRSEAPDLQLIFLHGPTPVLADRLGKRRGHFMPPSLLDSQLAALEEPASDEEAWVADVRESPPDIVRALAARASQ
jgi:gluconokinase